MAVTDPDLPSLAAIHAARRAAIQAQAQARIAAGEQPSITAAGNDRVAFIDAETGLSLSMLLSNLNITVAQGPVQNGPVATGVAATDTANVVSFIASTSVGDHLIFPPGEYSFNAIVQIPSDRSYTGAGAKGSVGARTCFKMAAAANLDAVCASALWFSASATPTSAGPINVTGICFDANRDNQSSGAGHGLIGMNYQSTIRECKASNTRGDGFRWTSQTQAGNTVTNSCNEVRFVNCTSLNTGLEGFHIHEGDATNRLTDGFFIDNIVAGGDGRGITLDGSAGWKINGNHVYAVPFDGIKASKAFQTDVSNNYCEGWGWSTTAGTYMGINMSTSPALTLQASTISNNRISSYVSNTPAVGTVLRAIGYTTVNSGTSEVSITGNVCHGRSHTTGTTGILVNNSNAGAITYAAISGNTCIGWDTNFLPGSVGTLLISGGGNVGQQVPNEIFSATPLIRSPKAALLGVWRMILTANVTSSTIDDGVDGQTIVVQFQQDGAGSKTLVWPTNVSGAPAIASGANAVTTVFLTYLASTDTWYAK